MFWNQKPIKEPIVNDSGRVSFADSAEEDDRLLHNLAAVKTFKRGLQNRIWDKKQWFNCHGWGWPLSLKDVSIKALFL